MDGNEPKEESNFREDLKNLINKYSLENGSDTPDFILAEYLVGCLELFDKGVCRRIEWYSGQLKGADSEKEVHI